MCEGRILWQAKPSQAKPGQAHTHAHSHKKERQLTAAAGAAFRKKLDALRQQAEHSSLRSKWQGMPRVRQA